MDPIDLSTQERFKLLTKQDFLPGGRFDHCRIQHYHGIPRSIIDYVYGGHYLPADLERRFKHHLMDIMMEIDADREQQQQEQQQQQQNEQQQPEIDETDSADSGYQSSQAY